MAQLQDKLRQATAHAEAAEARAGDASRAQALLQSRIEKLQDELDAARAAGAQAPRRATRRRGPARSRRCSCWPSAPPTPPSRTQRHGPGHARRRPTRGRRHGHRGRAEAARVRAEARAEADEADPAPARGPGRRRSPALEDFRAQLTADVAALESFLDDQRASLREGLGRIQAVLDDPGVAAGRRPLRPPRRVARRRAGHRAGRARRGARARRRRLERHVGAAVGEVEPAPADELPELVPSPSPSREPEPERRARARAARGSRPARRRRAGASREAASTEAAEPGAGESLFSVPDPTVGPASGPPTAQSGCSTSRPSRGRRSGTSATPDEEADAAMRAFFEAEFDDEDRFGR